jgi:CheY-like chemotaxis protein
MRVLLIDDGAAESLTFRRLTGGNGVGRYAVDRVSTQGEACEAMEIGDHDAYIVDHLVGTRTGFDLLSWVKTRGLRIPIVFVSGSSDHGTGVTAVSAGASCYVVSDSIDTGLLEHSMRNAVEQMRALDRLSSAGIEIDVDASMKTRMLFRIAEKLREPSTAVLDVSRRSLESALPASALESFGLIEDKANTLLTLANDLNDLALLEAGHLRFNTETFSLRGLVFHMNQKIGSAARDHDPEISVEIAPDVPDAVVGDPGRLRLVVITFIESVVARSNANRIIVRIRVAHRAPGAITLRFEIEAVGRRSVYNSSAVRKHSLIDVDGDIGTTNVTDALGMPAALEIVSRMGGTVTVDGDQDSFASVQLTIRLQIREEGHPTRPDLDADSPLSGPILVIADNADARHSLMSALGGADLPYLAAPNVEAWSAGQLAVREDAELPALAIIESSEDSFSVCDEFNDIVSGEVPVVVVVAFGNRGDAARCRERGVRGYLPRPLDSGDLVDVVRSSMALTTSGDSTTLVTRHWLREGRLSLHVLVVDDSSTNRFLLTRMLEQRGHSTVTADDGREATKACSNEVFDVVLMDVMMPVMGGFEATRLIRELHSESSAQPLIVGVSAFADQVNIERSQDAGMDEFLAKPVQPDDLFAAIEQSRSVVLA